MASLMFNVFRIPNKNVEKVTHFLDLVVSLLS